MSTPPSDPYQVDPPFRPQPAPQPAPAASDPAVDLSKPAVDPSTSAPEPTKPAQPAPFAQGAPPPPLPSPPPTAPYGYGGQSAPPYGYGGQSPYPSPYGTPAQPAWYPGGAAPWQSPPPRPRTSGMTARLGWMLLVLGILTILTSALPWGTVHLASGQSCRVLGVDSGACGPHSGSADYNLGILTIILSVPVIVMGLLRGCVRRTGLALAAGIVGLVLGCLIALLAAVGLTGPDGLPSSTRFSTDYGVWLTLTLAVLLIGASIWAIVKRR